MTKENNTLSLNSLANDGTKSNRKRVGRGIGSGNGKTAGSCLLYTSDAADE